MWDDTGRWIELLKPCLPYVDYFVHGLAEARALTGRQAPEEVATLLLVAEVVGTVALKVGADGCLVKSRDRLALHAPAFKVPWSMLPARKTPSPPGLSPGCTWGGHSWTLPGLPTPWERSVSRA